MGSNVLIILLLLSCPFVFLQVFRRFFDSRSTVELYDLEEVCLHTGLTKDTLILLALLLGRKGIGFGFASMKGINILHSNIVLLVRSFLYLLPQDVTILSEFMELAW